MRFAIVNKQRSLPSPGLSAFCPSCSAPVISKCGDLRVHHWAHRARTCDHWWGPETVWHREWKQNFEDDWQEVTLRNEWGEKHIADVRTPHGVTIEFQHSHLGANERTAREYFYGDMIWVVDGLRLKRDLPRFIAGRRAFKTMKPGRIYLHQVLEDIFPRVWLTSRAPIFFDFGSEPSSENRSVTDGSLWCLLPQRVRGNGIILRYSRQEFIMAAREDSRLLLGGSVPASIDQSLAAERRAQAASYIQSWHRHQRRRF